MHIRHDAPGELAVRRIAVTQPSRADHVRALIATTPRRARVPHVEQLSEVDCGAASLAMVLGYFGRWESLVAVRTACGVSRDGATALDLVRAARSYGLQCDGFMGDVHRLNGVCVPAIVWLRNSHFAVLEGISRGRVHLNDPAAGAVSMSMSEFQAEFSHVYLTVAPGPGFTRTGQRFRVRTTLTARLRHSRAAAWCAVVAGVLGMVVGVLAAPLSQSFVDGFLATGVATLVPAIVGALTAVALVRGGLTLLQFGVLSRLQAQLGLVGGGRYVDHLLRAPMAFFGVRSPGDLAHRADYAVSIAVLLSSQVAATAIAALGIVVYAGLLVYYQWSIGIIVILLSSLDALAMRLVLRRRRTAQDVVIRRENELRGTLTQVIRSIDTVRATGADGQAFTRLSRQQAAVVSGASRLVGATSLLSALPVAVALMSSAVVLVLGGQLVIAGELSLGALLAMQVLVAGMLAPLTTLTEATAQLQTVHGALISLQDVLEQPDAVADSDPAAATTSDLAAGTLTLRGVTFGYRPGAAPLIRDLTVSVAAGRRVAIVGPTGVGKTTIANLAAGLLHPWDGDVLLGGRPVTAFDPQTLPCLLAKVDQRIAIFTGTIRENVAMFSAAVSEADVVAALRDAQLLEDVLARKGGLDAPILDDGRDFSGGQRQRLDIARALATNPRVLVLDEATSSLDRETEARVHAALRARGTSCLIVAHRLETVRDADHIVVLGADGSVLEEGTHTDLLAKKGAYYHLAAQDEEFLTAVPSGEGSTVEGREPVSAAPSPAQIATAVAQRTSADADVLMQTREAAVAAITGRVPVTAPLVTQPIVLSPAQPKSVAHKTPDRPVRGHPPVPHVAPGQSGPPPRLAQVVARVAAFEGGTAPAASGPDHLDGSASRQGLATLAESVGARLGEVRLTSGWRRARAHALIAWQHHDEADRLVALIPRWRGYVLDACDGSPPIRLRHDFDAGLTGVAYQWQPGSAARTSSALLRFALHGTRVDVAAAACAGALVAILGLLTPILTQVILGVFVPTSASRAVWGAGLVLVIAAGSAGLLTVVQVRAMARTSQRATERVQDAAWDRLLRLPAPAFRTWSQGDLAVRLMAGNWLRSALDPRTLGAGLAAMFALVNLLLIAVLDLWLAGVAGLAVAASTVVVALAIRRLERRSRVGLDAHRSAEAWLLELVNGVGKVRVAGAIPRMSALYLARMARQAAANAAATRVLGWLGAGLAVIGGMTAALFALTAWGQSATGGVTVSAATYLAASAAVNVMIGAWAGLAAVALPFGTARPVGELLKPVLAADPEPVGGRDPGVLSGSVTMRGVEFCYEGAAGPVLHGVDLTVEPGEFVAIVGPSGAGKSTIARLLLGLERPAAGTICYDGLPLDSLNLHALRQRVGAVLQDGQVLHGTVLDTILGGISDDEAAAWAAAEQADVARDLRALPMGMQTLIDPGTVSGGQTQRLLLARLFARHPAVVIADEATSALDNNAQAQVMSALEHIGATRIVIAHRLSTVRSADRIVVLDGGRIVESGSYPDLLAAGGLFSRMVRAL